MKLLRFLLFPFAILYDVITRIRNFCYDKGVFKSTKFNIPVIAVGNLNVGGTGKTPQIEYLIRLLKDDYTVAVLSRGYKRKTKGFIKLTNLHTAEDVGDEPLQFFKKYGNDVIVAVDADRTNGIQELLKEEKKPEIVLLDDAFQHRKVKAGYYILLTKYNDLYSNDFVLPTGNLRESSVGAKRANTIVVTKCPKDISQQQMKTIAKRLNIAKHQNLFFSFIDYNSELQGSNSLTIDDLKNTAVVLVTGIANPTPLLEFLSENAVNFKHLQFPDHYNFTQKDIERIKGVINNIESSNKVLLTTEKDFMRLSKSIDNLSFIEIKTVFVKNENVFDRLVINKING